MHLPRTEIEGPVLSSQISSEKIDLGGESVSLLFDIGRVCIYGLSVIHYIHFVCTRIEKKPYLQKNV